MALVSLDIQNEGWLEWDWQEQKATEDEHSWGHTRGCKTAASQSHVSKESSFLGFFSLNTQERFLSSINECL